MVYRRQLLNPDQVARAMGRNALDINELRKMHQ
jgi:hypothetical protein